MNKNIEEQLKEFIIKHYGDMKTFALQADIPNSTLSTMFTRGILNSNIKSVVLVAKALKISVDGLVLGKIEPCSTKKDNAFPYNQIPPIQQLYENLNNDGQKILMAQAEFLNSQPQYKKCDTISKKEIS